LVIHGVGDVMTKKGRMSKIKKELAWYKAYADQVQSSNHRAHEYACEHADEVTGVIQYPYSEGQNYWTVEDTVETYEDSQGIYEVGLIAVQSCWDDQSEIFHRENPEREYFDSLDEILDHAYGDFQYVKVSCFNCKSDIKTGDYLVSEDFDKFHKSY